MMQNHHQFFKITFYLSEMDLNEFCLETYVTLLHKKFHSLQLPFKY